MFYSKIIKKISPAFILYNTKYPFKSLGQYVFFIEINTFIQQGHVLVIKSDSKNSKNKLFSPIIQFILVEKKTHLSLFKKIK